MEKKRATTYIPIQNRKGCQPPMALNVVRFMDFRLKSFQRDNELFNLCITKELTPYFIRL